MTGQNTDPYLGRLQVAETGLRHRLATVAASIACTEDQVAETLERMAVVMPYDAARLRAHAARARRYASQERKRAATFSPPN